MFWLMAATDGWEEMDGLRDKRGRTPDGRTDALFNASLVSQRIGRSPSPSPVYLQRGKREREDDITSARKVAMRRFDSLLSSFTATNVCMCTNCNKTPDFELRFEAWT